MPALNHTEIIMAYIDQARKTTIVAALKRVMPAGWKFSTSIHNHSTITLTISAAPEDLTGEYVRTANASRSFGHYGDILPAMDHCSVNEYHLDSQFTGRLLSIFTQLSNALNAGNHDNSDIQTDYFDVGWYTSINIGRWDKPFVNTSLALAA